MKARRRYLLAIALLFHSITACNQSDSDPGLGVNAPSADADTQTETKLTEDAERTGDGDSEILLGRMQIPIGVAPGVLKFFQEADLDADGVANEKDECPDTQKGWVVDDKGCPLSITFLQKSPTAALDLYKAFTPTLKNVGVTFSQVTGKILLTADRSSFPEEVKLRFVNLLPTEKVSASSDELCVAKGSLWECDLSPLGEDEENLNFDVRVYVTDTQGKLSSDYHRIQLALGADDDARFRYDLDVSRVTANGVNLKTESLIQNKGTFPSRKAVKEGTGKQSVHGKNPRLQRLFAND